MRRFPLALLTLVWVFCCAGTAAASTSSSTSSRALRRLQATLNRGMNQVGGSGGALVVDLTTHATLFRWKPSTGRMPASVEKLYTTSVALARFGAGATLTTDVLGVGSTDETGTWDGTLYIRGGGDPTFGTAAFDRANYGTGATVGRLADNLKRMSGITVMDGRVVGDESMFDALRGTPPYGYAFNRDVEGSLSALSFNRGVSADWRVPVPNPAQYGADQLVAALHARSVDTSGLKTSAGVTPASAQLMASVHSPRMATLVALTNAPSDNFFAETLLKDLGARFGEAGTTAAGAAVVRAQLAKWGIHPRLEDGSGLSRRDSTSPAQVVKLLSRLATSSPFVASLAVAGRTGTLYDRMRRTAAQNNCDGKTGTLHDVSDLAGLCRARDGHTLAFALLMNYVDPYYAHGVQDAMTEAVAAYNG